MPVLGMCVIVHSVQANAELGRNSCTAQGFPAQGWLGLGLVAWAPALSLPPVGCGALEDPTMASSSVKPRGFEKICSGPAALPRVSSKP